jgi:hypothetical protein
LRSRLYLPVLAAALSLVAVGCSKSSSDTTVAAETVAAADTTAAAVADTTAAMAPDTTAAMAAETSAEGGLHFRRPQG